MTGVTSCIDRKLRDRYAPEVGGETLPLAGSEPQMHPRKQIFHFCFPMLLLCVLLKVAEVYPSKRIILSQTKNG
eukprot:1944243-Amphidinium_carterae.1